MEEIQLANKYEALAWICKNQLGRRNLSPERKKFLLGKEYESTKLAVGGQPGNCNKVNRCDQNDHIDSEKRTCERIAVEHGVGSATVRRAEKYMNGVETADDAAPGAREEILNGKIKAADREICAIAKAPKEQRSEIVAELRKPKSERDKQLASFTKSPSVKVESFDDDGSRFLIGISKKVQGYKRALTESDQKALKNPLTTAIFGKLLRIIPSTSLRLKVLMTILLKIGSSRFESTQIFRQGRKTGSKLKSILTICSAIWNLSARST